MPPDHHFISNSQNACLHETSTIKIYPTSSSLLPGRPPGHFFLSLKILTSGSLVSSTLLHRHSTYIPANYWIPTPTQMYHPWSLRMYHPHLGLEALCILLFGDLPFCGHFLPGSYLRNMPPLRYQILTFHSQTISFYPPRHLVKTLAKILIHNVIFSSLIFFHFLTIPLTFLSFVVQFRVIIKILHFQSIYFPLFSCSVLGWQPSRLNALFHLLSLAFTEAAGHC